MSSQQITIPSFDGTQLEARLYPARSASGSSRASASLEVAIIAHPYGFLGGSMNDHVVQTLNDTLREQGIPTLLYNSRGVGKSTGRASWTGEPERKDYQAVVNWTVEHAGSMESWTGREGQHDEKVTVFCCGYSFGALMAGQAVPPTSDSEIKVDTRYILISPPISSLVGFLLTPFRTSQYTRAIKRIIFQDAAVQDTRERRKILFVYGGRDNFTDVETYRNWTTRLVEGRQEIGRDVLSVVEVEEADHFWRNPRHREELSEAVCKWL